MLNTLFNPQLKEAFKDLLNKTLKKTEHEKLVLVILSAVLLLGLTLFLTGYFWQAKTTRLQTLYYLLVVAPIMLSLLYQIKNYSFNPVFILAFTLIIYSVASVFWSEDVTTQAFFHQFKKAILLLSLFLSINHIQQRYLNFEYHVLHLMTFFATFLALYNIYTLATTVGLSGRINGWGLLDNANVTAEVFGLIFLYTFIQFLKTEDKTTIFLYLLIAIIILAEIFLNKSRGQLLALIIASFLSLFFVPKENLKRLTPLVLLTIISAILLFISTNVIETIANRPIGFSCRDTIWRDLLTSATQTPIFGRGEGSSSGYITYCLELSPKPLNGTHSVYMQIFLYTGIIGVILALSLTAYSLKAAFKSANQNDVFWGIIIIYGFLAFIPNGDSLISRPNEVWLLFWVPIAFIASRYHHDNA